MLFTLGVIIFLVVWNFVGNYIDKSSSKPGAKIDETLEPYDSYERANTRYEYGGDRSRGPRGKHH